MLPDSTRPRGIHLRVNDLDEEQRFYEDAIGLRPVLEEDQTVRLETPGGLAFVHLTQDSKAPSRPAGTEGLFHMAFLVPSREDLASLLAWFDENDVTLTGVADHGVSEALYLEDPEGNGMEVYRDRPEQAWPRQGEEIAMVTQPLDVDSLLESANVPRTVPEGTRLGHVHLETTKLGPARRFYQDLGFRVTQSTFPGATFLSLGGYHHHVGLNRWRARKPRRGDALGLLGVTWSLQEDPLAKLGERIDEESMDRREDALVIEDTMGLPHRFIRSSESH